MNDKKKPFLKFYILNSNILPEELIEIVNGRYDFEDYKAELKIVGKNLYSIFLSRKIKEKYLRGDIIIDKIDDNLWIIICDEKRRFSYFVVERMINKLYPKISKIFLNTDQVKKLLSEIEKSDEWIVHVNYFSTKIEPKPEKLSFIPTKKGTIQQWYLNSFYELEKYEKTNVITITNINFRIFNRDELIILDGFISRDGKCQLKYGSYIDFYNIVISNIIKIGIKLKGFYANREKYDVNGTIHLNPFKIEYKDHFNQPQLKVLGSKLSSKYVCSIIHAGNPYFAVNLIDSDGSSYGVTVLKNKITIVPLVNASSEATWKLTNELQEILGDGLINEITR